LFERINPAEVLASLFRDIRDYFEYLEETSCPRKAAGEWTGAIGKDHRRIERWNVSTVTALEWLESAPDWKDLSAIIRYRCSRTVGQECTITDRYYITSLKEDAKTLGPNIRVHWSIENHPHWSLDVLFREDACQVRKDHAPENLNVLRKIALARLRSAVVPQKRFRAYV
jgi:predicted transposase YbfD/YdcC